MLDKVKSLVTSILNAYPTSLCRSEFESQCFVRFNERPVEFEFVFRKFAELYPKTVLDVGTGLTALPQLLSTCGAHVTAIDNVRDYWPRGMVNRHWHVIDDDIRHSRLTGRFEMITCISVLEHIRESDAAVRGMFGLLAPGGSLILTCPYEEREYVPNVYELPGSSYGHGLPYVTQSFSRAELDGWLVESDATVVEQEYWEFWGEQHWTVGEQRIPPRRSSATESHQLTCLHLERHA